MATAKEICDGVPKSCLDRAVSDIHIAYLAKSMTLEWQELAPFLDITPAEEGEILELYRGRLQLQKREALRKWKDKGGSKATYRKLIVIFCAQGGVDLAETLKDLLLTSENPSTAGVSSHNRDVIDVFHDYLHDCYSDLPHPSSQQWPLNTSECYIEPKLFDVPLKSGEPKPTSLQAIFAAGNSKAKRKVILIEGVAGAGKTTLSWHACKEWAASNLFKDIKLLIHVSLSDATLHSVSKLADLIPHPSEDLRSSVAKAIADKRGKGICFLLEGCDEAPQSLWQSFLFRFIAGTGGRSMLPDAHIILTSRPGIPIQVAECLTGKVIVTGFNLLDYVHSMENSTQLLEILEMKPELYSLCHLPLNAVILVYLYRNFKDKLPTTRTGLFDLLVRNFLIRHMQIRANCEPTSIDNFPTDLPDDIRSSLSKISALAYDSLLDRKIIIDQEMFQRFGVDNDFGFLQVHQTLTMCGPHKQFLFMYLSLQEFLAAFHISQMNDHQQVTACKLVFDQNPLSPVLTFYSGLTGLKLSEVRGILLKVLNEPVDIDDIVKHLGLNDPNTVHGINPAHDLRRHMLALMNCVYETQNVSLFGDMKLSAHEVFTTITDEKTYYRENTINIRLLGMLLYPTDCLAIGYFVRHAINDIHMTCLVVDCCFCMLGDMEIKALATELQKRTHKSNVLVFLSFYGVLLSTRAISSLITLISTDSCVAGLSIDCDLIENQALFFKYCIERFNHASKPNKLGLRAIHNPNNIYYFLLLLRCPCLCDLNVTSGSHLFANPSGILLFCEALKYSHLKSLNLTDCDIDDNSLKLLITAVCHEYCVLEILELIYNPYTEYGVTCSLNLLLDNPFVRLHTLSVSCVTDDHNKLLKSINNIRQLYGQGKLVLEQTEKFLSRVKNEENTRGIALLNHYMLTRPDLAIQPLHH